MSLSLSNLKEFPQSSSWSTLVNFNNYNLNDNNNINENRSKSSPDNVLLSQTPICSDIDDDDAEMDRDEFDDYLLPNIGQTPGAKQNKWYMSFPSDHDDDDENELKHNISNMLSPNEDRSLHTKSEPTIHSMHQYQHQLKPTDLIPDYSNNIFSNNNSLSSFDLDINTENFENIQQQQTDIFSSATYNAYDSFARLDKITKNQLYSEGVNINTSSKNKSISKIPNKNENDDCINDGNITMMGYINDSNNKNLFGLRLNNNNSMIHSEGNIICNNNDNSDDREILINDEGTNDGFTKLPMFIDRMKEDHDDDDDDEEDDDLDLDLDLDGFVNNKFQTLLGPIHTNDGYDDNNHHDSEENVDEDDDIYFNDINKGGITLMGDPDLEQNKISFNVKNEIQNEIGITLMGHFENEVDQKIPFK